MKKILMLTKYGRKGASSRLRSYQYVRWLKKHGWAVEVNNLFCDDYLENSYSGRWVRRNLNVLGAYLRRLISLFSVRQYDLIWIEYEVFPYFPALVERILSCLQVPYIVDYDDAVFHRYDMSRARLIRYLLSNKIDVVMKSSSLVVVCNEYLAERARSAGALNVLVVPTVVDLDRYGIAVKKGDESRKAITVGWVGSPSTSIYLEMLRPIIERLRKQFLVKFVVVGGTPEGWGELEWVEVIPWSEETEVEIISRFDIGVMPLDSTPWERGKCGYKIIQYMASGIPVVASPVGVNPDLVDGCGLLASTLDEWQVALHRLMSDPGLREKLGERGRMKVERSYSVSQTFPVIEKALEMIRSRAICVT